MVILRFLKSCLQRNSAGETILNTPFENIDDFLEILTSFKSFLSIRTVFNENVGIK